LSDQTILNAIHTYRLQLEEQGIPVDSIILFGSQATGNSNDQSDIDLLVISPLFDGPFPRALHDQLWRIAARTDSRIEPIPCGLQQWLEDDRLPIIEQIRREGIRIA